MSQGSIESVSRESRLFQPQQAFAESALEPSHEAYDEMPGRPRRTE